MNTYKYLVLDSEKTYGVYKDYGAAKCLADFIDAWVQEIEIIPKKEKIMGRPYTEWDENELKQLEEMKKDGYTVKQISQKLGRGEANNHVHGTNIIKNLDGEVWCCEKNYKP